MNRLVFVCASFATAAAFVAAGAGAAPPATCSAALTIFTTSPGDVQHAGNTTHYRGSGVGGSYTSGFLAGYTLSGTQDIVQNAATGTAVLHGEFVATGGAGSLTVLFTGRVEFATNTGTGHFIVVGGTGGFAGFHWTGEISAQLTSLTPPTFVATDSGFCRGGP